MVVGAVTIEDFVASVEELNALEHHLCTRIELEHYTENGSSEVITITC